MAARVGNDTEAGDFRGGAGRGVDGHQGHHGFGRAVQPLIVGDLAAVADNQADALGAVVRGAAAQGEQRVTLVRIEFLYAGLHVFIGGVGLGLAEDMDPESGGLQNALYALRHAGLGQKCVGNNHNPAAG